MKIRTRAFLAVSGAGLVGVVGLPLALCPRTWSRVLGWEPGVETPVGDYLARSLGAIGLSLGLVCFVASCRRKAPKELLLLLATIGAGATIVHARGVLRGDYPSAERTEVPVLLGWTLWGIRELVAAR